MLVENSATIAYAASVIAEAAIVGAALAAGLAFAVMVRPLEDSVTQAVITGFVVGAALHMLFELAQANTWYCKRGAACSR